MDKLQEYGTLNLSARKSSFGRNLFWRQIQEGLFKMLLGVIMIGYLVFIIRPCSADLKPGLMMRPNVSIVYPLLSDNYLPYRFERWVFDLKTLFNFTVAIKRLDLEKSNDCKADYLMINDEIGFKEMKFCGEQRDYANLTHYQFLTYMLTVTFSTDSSWEGTGFAIEVTGYPPNTNKLCESMFRSQYLEITSSVIAHEDMYPPLLNCSWDILSSSGLNIILNFLKFDIEYSGPYCPSDRLEVWALPLTNQSGLKHLGNFCGRQAPWELNTNTSFVQIRFRTDEFDNAKGFRLRYTFTKISEPNHGQYKVTATEISNSIPVSCFTRDKPSILTWQIRTQPGFNIHLQTVGGEVGSLVEMYDGPGLNYDSLTPTNHEHSVHSSGFYLTICINLYRPTQTVTIATNLSFEVSNGVTSNTTSSLFSGKYAFLTFPLTNLKHLLYIAAIVPANRHVRFNIKPVISFIREGSNTDNCGINGIAFYDGTVSFDNLIGPFCDLDEDYTRSILQKIVMSSSVAYIVLYDYGSRSRLGARYVWVTDEQCRGFQITERMFQLSKVIDQDNFTLHVGIHNTKRYVNIFFKESKEDCVAIHLLPFQGNLTGIHISLTGYFSYRICRQWKVRKLWNMMSDLNGSKYDSSEHCSSHFISTGNTTEIQESLETVDGFSKEVTIIELGPVSDNLCIDILCLPFQKNNILLPCGVLRGNIASGCHLKITGPILDTFSQYIWCIQLDHMYGDASNIEELFMVITEQYNDTRDDVKTVISNYNIGQMRTFFYYSLPCTELHILTMGIKDINLKFSREYLFNPIFNAQSHTQSGYSCVVYREHCYRLLSHSVSQTWQISQRQCERDGGYLVSINSAEELKFLKTCLETLWEKDFYGKGRGMIFIGLSDKLKHGLYRWEDGSPLTVSDWYLPFASFDNVLPETPQPPINLGKIQPEADSSQRCVAMIPGNPRFSTNWRKVYCEKLPSSSNVYSICEMENTSVINKDTDSLQISKDKQCPFAWNFVNGFCLRLATTKRPLHHSMSKAEAKSICEHGLHGLVAKADKITSEILRKYLRAMQFSSGDIWVTLSSGILGCVSLSILSKETLYNERLAAKTNTCPRTGGIALHVLCEIPVISTPQQCESFQFRCEDGTCLNPDRVCDKHTDCVSCEDEENCVLQNSTFRCFSGESISVFRYCDFNVDCEDGSDESRCVHDNCSQSQYQCTNGQCISLERRCNHQSDCLDDSDENMCDWEIECKGFKCPVVGCISFDKVDDLKPDCPDSTEADESINTRDQKRYMFYVREQNNKFTSVKNYKAECPYSWDHQRCHQDHIQCFPRHKTCVYDQDTHGQLLFCSNGAHLRHCEDFECPDQFKCPASYCIPHHKVCDGVQDCVNGEDETNCNNRTCPNQLRCGLSNQCVSLEHVCDNTVHCRSGIDDEMFCNLLLSDCPSNCTCHGFGVTCSGGKIFQDIPPIRMAENLMVLDLSHNNITVTNRTFFSYRKLVYLYLKNNGISSLGERTFEFLSNLLLLDLSDNMVTFIEPGTFLGLQNLHSLLLYGNPIHQIFPRSFIDLGVLPVLDLSGMNIEVIESHTFAGLHEMTVLNLSNNFIYNIGKESFSSLLHLRTLWLTNNNLDETKAEFFRNLIVKTLHTDSYVFCCNAGNHIIECSPAVNSYTSCSDLLPSEFLQAIVWAFAVLALVGNVGVIFWRIFKKKVNDITSIFVLNLSAADLLMGVYLLSLSIANIQFKGIYTLNDKRWRHSGLCKTLGVISTISCEMSMFTLICIATDRTKRLAYPFTSYQFNRKSAPKILALGWFICISVGVIPFFIPSYFGHYYSRNAVCLPFNFADPLGKGWQFSFAIFVALNAIGLLLVVVMYGLTYIKVKKTQKRAGRKDRLDLDVARKLTIIIVTDIICVIPLTMSNLLSVLGEPINRDMASVLTTVILPINSALNPYVFTFSAKSTKKRRVKLTQ